LVKGENIMFKKQFEIRLINGKNTFNARPASQGPDPYFCDLIDYDGDCRLAEKCQIDW